MIAIKHHFVRGGTPTTEIDTAENRSHAIALIEAAMHKEGWSDSQVVNVAGLPDAARETWLERAAARG